jgi:hypothetical protein
VFLSVFDTEGSLLWIRGMSKICSVIRIRTGFEATYHPEMSDISENFKYKSDLIGGRNGSLKWRLF